MSDLQIYDCEQNSELWRQARAGIPTASQFATVLAKGKDSGSSITRKKYLYQLAGEILTGEPAETYTNGHMERGHAMEDEARDLYRFLHDAPLQRVGFLRRGNHGYSPDSFVAEDGLLEIKTALPHILIDYLMADKFPAEHVAQCQGGLFVSGRKWLDLVVYWPRMPLFVKRIERDEEYHAKLSKALDDFTNELEVVVSRLRKIAA